MREGNELEGNKSGRRTKGETVSGWVRVEGVAGWEVGGLVMSVVVEGRRG